jgi:threonine aldolase
MENAHSNGSVVPLSSMKEIKLLAEDRGIPVHLDGARIFNAASALGVPASEIADCADSVMFCLSKGLCAPVGSLLAGSAEFAERALLKRKIMGGGMRQAGFLAAAGIVALKQMTGRVADDHANAKRLAASLSSIPGISVDEKALDINMVFFTAGRLKDGCDAERIVRMFADEGIAIHPPEDGVFRFVTHYWIGDIELEKIIDAARRAFGRIPGGAVLS